MHLSPLFNDSKPNISVLSYSEALRGVVTILVQPNIVQTLKIIVSSTPDFYHDMDVISVNILSVGRNIPCLETGIFDLEIKHR